jgi:hypothetical protein
MSTCIYSGSEWCPGLTKIGEEEGEEEKGDAEGDGGEEEDEERTGELESAETVSLLEVKTEADVGYIF